MVLSPWLHSLRRSFQRPRRRGHRRYVKRDTRPTVELLEDRTLLDGAGPHIFAATPDPAFDLRASTLDSVEVTFHEAINEATFTAADVAITGPAGSITPAGITPLGGNQYEISFAAQSLRGTYSVLVGPEIEDAAGNPMDQDGDGTTGEAIEDVFALSFGAYSADTVFTAAQPIAAGDTTYDNQDICVIGATLTIDGPHTFNTVHLIDSAAVTHSAASTTGLDLTVSDDAIIDVSSSIAANGRGYAGVYDNHGQGPGAGRATYVGGGGGGYGGVGASSRGAALVVLLTGLCLNRPVLAQVAVGTMTGAREVLVAERSGWTCLEC